MFNWLQLLFQLIQMKSTTPLDLFNVLLLLKYWIRKVGLGEGGGGEEKIASVCKLVL